MLFPLSYLSCVIYSFLFFSLSLVCRLVSHNKVNENGAGEAEGRGQGTAGQGLAGGKGRQGKGREGKYISKMVSDPLYHP